jgi:transcriptional regulator with XRE-family HTH domain
MPRKNFKELRADLADRVGEERVAAAEHTELANYELEQLALGDIRKARSLTQTQLAKALGVTQAQVSRIEHQTDLFLSTLASYIQAMGGELDLIATFPDARSVVIDVGEFAGAAKSPPDLMSAIAESLASPEDVLAHLGSPSPIPGCLA